MPAEPDEADRMHAFNNPDLENRYAGVDGRELGVNQ